MAAPLRLRTASFFFFFLAALGVRSAPRLLLQRTGFLYLQHMEASPVVEYRLLSTLSQ